MTSRFHLSSWQTFYNIQRRGIAKLPGEYKLVPLLEWEIWQHESKGLKCSHPSVLEFLSLRNQH